MSYRVLVVIKDKFYPFDDNKFATFVAARRHQKTVRAAVWRKNDTAVQRPDGVILNYIDEDIEKMEADMKTPREMTAFEEGRKSAYFGRREANPHRGHDEASADQWDAGALEGRHQANDDVIEKRQSSCR